MEIPSTTNSLIQNSNVLPFNNMNVIDNIISDALNNYKNDNLEIRKSVCSFIFFII